MVRPSACHPRIRAIRSAVVRPSIPGERLVEEDDASVLDDEPREQGALELTAGQGADQPVLEAEEAHGREGADQRPAVRERAAPEAEAPPASHRHQIEDAQRKAAVDLAGLGQVGDGIGTTGPVDPSVEAADFTDDPLEQGRFSRAVGTDKREKGSGGNNPVQMMHGGMAIVAERQTTQGDGAGRSGGVCHRYPMAQTIAPQTSPDRIAARTSREAAPAWNRERRGEGLIWGGRVTAVRVPGKGQICPNGGGELSLMLIHCNIASVQRAGPYRPAMRGGWRARP